MKLPIFFANMPTKHNIGSNIVKKYCTNPATKMKNKAIREKRLVEALRTGMKETACKILEKAYEK